MKKVFSSYNFDNTSSIEGQSLNQLIEDSSVLSVEKDPLTGIEKVCLQNGIYRYSTTAYINNTIRDNYIVNTKNITNLALPAEIPPAGKFTVKLELKDDCFFIPSSLEVFLILNLNVRDTAGLRNIEAKDFLCGCDGLNPIKSIRPIFDQYSIIPTSKDLDQRLYNRLIALLTKPKNREASQDKDILEHLSFFETETCDDNKDGKTHSHKFVGADDAGFLDLTDAGASKQNIYLSKILTKKFVVKLDLENLAPFDINRLHTRPTRALDLQLEFSNFSDWLRLVKTPDGTAHTCLPDASIFQKLVLSIAEIKFNLTQVVLNDALYNSYLEKMNQNKLANLPHSVVDLNHLSNSIRENSNDFSFTLFNQIIADKYLFVFRNNKNLNDVEGNIFFFSNVLCKEIHFTVQGSSQNRYQQHRTSSWVSNDNIVRTIGEFNALDENKKRTSKFAMEDLIFKTNDLFIGSDVFSLEGVERLCNNESMYQGHAIYSVLTTCQIVSDSLLKESNKRGLNSR